MCGKPGYRHDGTRFELSPAVWTHSRQNKQRTPSSVRVCASPSVLCRPLRRVDVARCRAGSGLAALLACSPRAHHFAPRRRRRAPGLQGRRENTARMGQQPRASERSAALDNGEWVDPMAGGSGARTRATAGGVTMKDDEVPAYCERSRGAADGRRQQLRAAERPSAARSKQLGRRIWRRREPNGAHSGPCFQLNKPPPQRVAAGAAPRSSCRVSPSARAAWLFAVHARPFAPETVCGTGQLPTGMRWRKRGLGGARRGSPRSTRAAGRARLPEPPLHAARHRVRRDGPKHVIVGHVLLRRGVRRLLPRGDGGAARAGAAAPETSSRRSAARATSARATGTTSG